MKKYLIVLSALVMIGNNCSFTMEFNPSAGQETPSGAKIQNETTQFGTKNNNDRKQFNENKDLKQTSILNGEEVCSPVSTAQELGPYPPVNQEDPKYNNMNNECQENKFECNNMCPNGQPCEEENKSSCGKYYMEDTEDNANNNQFPIYKRSQFDANKQSNLRQSLMILSDSEDNDIDNSKQPNYNNNQSHMNNNTKIDPYDYKHENETNQKEYDINDTRHSTIAAHSPDYGDGINMEVEKNDGYYSA